jgi:low molecular weight phosphotyrosine protein phosphatase
VLLQSIPLGMERRDVLQGTLGATGTAVKLFLCTHNSARSQMAEGLMRNLVGDQFEVLSAGTEARASDHWRSAP